MNADMGSGFPVVVIAHSSNFDFGDTMNLANGIKTVYGI